MMTQSWYSNVVIYHYTHLLLCYAFFVFLTQFGLRIISVMVALKMLLFYGIVRPNHFTGISVRNWKARVQVGGEAPFLEMLSWLLVMDQAETYSYDFFSFSFFREVIGTYFSHQKLWECVTQQRLSKTFFSCLFLNPKACFKAFVYFTSII
jgi:hypothetical protein